MSNNATETPLSFITTLEKVVSQETINERTSKQQKPTKKPETKFTSPLGFDMEYTNKTIQTPMPMSYNEKMSSTLNGSSEILSGRAAVARSTSAEVANRPTLKIESCGVTFAPNTKPPKVFRPSRIGYTDPPQKNQTKFGKAKLARDIPIFVGIIAILLFFAIQMGGVGVVANNGVKESPTAKLDRLKASIEQQMKKKMEIYENRTIGCNLFLADSTIPGAGLSLFSGTHYNENATVLESSLAFQFSESNKALIDYALLLKHHPLLDNLKGGVWMQSGNTRMTMTMTASREIIPGQELFLSFHDHPASSHWKTQLFSKIPTPTDFELADEIVKDEIITQTRSTQRKGERQSGGGSKSMSIILVYVPSGWTNTYSHNQF